MFNNTCTCHVYASKSLCSLGFVTHTKSAKYIHWPLIMWPWPHFPWQPHILVWCQFHVSWPLTFDLWFRVCKTHEITLWYLPINLKKIGAAIWEVHFAQTYSQNLYITMSTLKMEWTLDSNWMHRNGILGMSKFQITRDIVISDSKANTLYVQWTSNLK